MDAKDIKANLVGAALLRFKQFADYITEAIGHRARKRIYALANQGLECKTENPEFLHLIASLILKEVKQSNYLADKLIAFGDHEIAFIVLYASITHEAKDKKLSWRIGRPLIFRDEEKERLIDFLLAGGSNMRVFGGVRLLLCFAKAIPYDGQEKLYRKYFELHSEFTTPADFLEVYDMWTDLAPNIREGLRGLMKNALSYFRCSLIKSERAGGVEVIEGMGEGPKSGPDSN